MSIKQQNNEPLVQEETELEKSPSLEERPCFRCYSDYWTNHHNKKCFPGVWHHTVTTSKGGDDSEPTQRPVDTWICSELTIAAIARDKSARSFGQVLNFKNRLGQKQIWNMPSRLLAGSGDELLKELLDRGVKVNHLKRSKVAEYISLSNPSRTYWTANQVGWFEESFVLPTQTIGKDSEEIIFQTEGHNHQDYQENGSLAQWQKDVSLLCVGNPLLLFALSSAFTGALLKPCNADGFGFHIFGDSSKGKTTGLKIAASVWGKWEKYKRVWKATSNGLEGAATLFNDGLLTLDEIGDGDPKEVAEAIYTLFNGTSKQRATKTGAAGAIKSWRIVVLSNGEKTIESVFAEKQIRVKAGQLVRFLQLPIFGKHGAFDELHGYSGGRELSTAITSNAGKSYGAAGIAFLEKLTQDDDVLNNGTQVLETYLQEFINKFGVLTSQEERAARSFALVGMAGELATHYGVTGWKQGVSIKAAITCFEQWRKHRGVGDCEAIQIKEALLSYIEIYGDSRFSNTEISTKLQGVRSGYWREHYDGKQWLFTKSGLSEATRGFDSKQVLNVLRESGMLMLDSQGKSTKLVNFNNNDTGESRLYVIRLPKE